MIKGEHYYLHDTAQYTCSEGFKLEGNEVVKYTYSGQWSTPPRCYPVPKSFAEVATGFMTIYMGWFTVIVLAAPYLIVSMKYLIKMKSARKIEHRKDNDETANPEHRKDDDETANPDLKTEHRKDDDETANPDLEVDFFTPNHNSVTTNGGSRTLKKILENERFWIEGDGVCPWCPSSDPPKRNREYDGFVPYCFDSDDDFILYVLIPQMEETWGFKMYLHNGDFIVGRDITKNVQEGIRRSNSAIIVMSQGFVSSLWCNEEFPQCYLENMKDPSFNLFVLLMQPRETLVGISDYMKTFFERKTYLEMDDPEVYIKLAERLENARQPRP